MDQSAHSDGKYGAVVEVGVLVVAVVMVVVRFVVVVDEGATAA